MKKLALIITCSAVCVYVAAEVISRLPVKADDIDEEISSYPLMPDYIFRKTYDEVGKEVEDVTLKTSK